MLEIKAHNSYPEGSHLPNTTSQNIPYNNGTITVIIAVIICGGLVEPGGGEGSGNGKGWRGGRGATSQRRLKLLKLEGLGCGKRGI